MGVTVFMMNYQGARTMCPPISVTTITASSFYVFLIFVAQQRHCISPFVSICSRVLVVLHRYCVTCYNTITYKSPPMVIMATGGLEPPRQLSANSFQSYRACQLHHVAVMSIGKESSLSELSFPMLLLLRYIVLGQPSCLFLIGLIQIE